MRVYLILFDSDYLTRLIEHRVIVFIYQNHIACRFTFPAKQILLSLSVYSLPQYTKHINDQRSRPLSSLV